MRICEWHLIAIECNYTFVVVFVDEMCIEKNECWRMD